jgi:DNA-binding response OmpR family regulator
MVLPSVRTTAKEVEVDPDVAVLDVRPPDGNGIEQCRDLTY